MKPQVTKRQVLVIFNREVRPYITTAGAPLDVPLLRQAWNDWVDHLVKDGLLSEQQVKTWSHPFP